MGCVSSKPQERGSSAVCEGGGCSPAPTSSKQTPLQLQLGGPGCEEQPLRRGVEACEDSAGCERPRLPAATAPDGGASGRGDALPLAASSAEADDTKEGLEARRLAATRQCRALDTAAEAQFAAVTTLLQGIFKVPIAVVGLIDAERLIFVSAAGIPTGPGGRRVHSFCQASLVAKSPTMMVVEDALQDARFQHNEFVVGPPHIRFYTGAPLISSDGYVMGSLGIMDLVPRTFPAEMLNVLCNLAELVVRELERDKVIKLQREQLEAAHQGRLVRALSHYQEAVALCDLAHPGGWRVLWTNAAWARLTGFCAGATQPAAFWDQVQPEEGCNAGEELARVAAAVRERAPFQLTVTAGAVGRAGVPTGGVGGAGGGSHGQAQLHLNFRPSTHDNLGEGVPTIGIPNFVGSAGSAASLPLHYFALAGEGASETPRASASPPRRASLEAGGLGAAVSACRPSSTSTGSAGFHLGSQFGLKRPEALKDLKLGPIIGQGSFGKVYRGLWHGAHVAVKVMDSLVPLEAVGGSAGSVGSGRSSGRLGKPMLEALLSRELSHPQLIQTHEYAISIEETSGSGQLDGEEEEEEEEQLNNSQGWPSAGSNSSAAGPLGSSSGRGAGDSTRGTGSSSGGNAGMGRAGRGGSTGQTLYKEVNQRVWLIQQYANLGTLYSAIDRGWLRTKRNLDGPTNLLAVLQTAYDVCGGICYLHSRGVLHGDLTGNNVLLASSARDARRFTALIGDFGLSRVLGGEAIHTATTGSAHAMPPEALAGGELSQAVDAYSFGVLLVEMWSQERAWGGARSSQIIYWVTSLNQQLKVPEGAPPEYKALTEACLSREPAQRPSFEAILAALDVMLVEARAAAGPGSPPHAPPCSS